jgi:ankyrin repeat protein
MICQDLFDNYIKLVKTKKSPYNKETIDNFIITFIDNKDQTRIDKIKQYIELGCDINENIYGKTINWLEYSIYTNDIALIGFLIKSNAKYDGINKSGSNIIYTCVHASNPHMLKYFLNLGINPNLKNNDLNTPLIIALSISDGFECSKVLLEDMRVDIQESNKIYSLVDLIISKIDDGKKKYPELLDLLLKRKKKIDKRIDKSDMGSLRACVYYNQIDTIKIFLNNFPSCINKSSDDEDGNTIVHMALYEGHQDLLKYFFTFKELDYKKVNGEDGNYLEFLCYYRMVDLLEIYCKQYPKSLEITYNSHSIIECVITISDFRDIYNFEDIKKIIQILVSNGADINYKNDIGYTLIFPSIQYGNAEFVKFMIGLGAKIKEPVVNKDDEFPPFINNDPIGFAIQLGYFETVKVLIEHNAILHIVIKKNIKLYTSILLCLRYSREDCFNYLISIPKISRWLNSDVQIKNYLFDYALKHICINQSILKHFVPESKLKSIDFNDPIYNLSLNEKKIALNIDEYFDLTNKLVVLRGLKECIKIINKISGINTNNKSYASILECFKNLHQNIINSINEYEEIKNIKDDFYEWINIFSSIICEKLDYHITNNLKKIFEHVSKLYWKISDDDSDENTDSDKSDNKLISNEFEPKIHIKKIKNLYKLFASKKQILIAYEDEINQIINKYEYGLSKNKFDVYDDKKFVSHDVIIKKLFKLYFPNKQPHYEYMYHSIVYNTDKIISSCPNIIVISDNNIKSTVFDICSGTKPKLWINTYAPNIGKEEKTDLYHMFPFILDSILAQTNCVIIESTNYNGDYKTCYKYYFYGMIEYMGIVETGCYEYFINSNGTLFHRMFKSWEALPEYVIKMINH